MLSMQVGVSIIERTCAPKGGVTFRGALMNALSPEAEITLGAWKVGEESVRQYLKAAGDMHLEYFEVNLVPPLALAAYALGALLEKLALPPGAIHSLQEMETLGPVEMGEEIRGAARLERPRRRGSLQ